MKMRFSLAAAGALAVLSILLMGCAHEIARTPTQFVPIDATAVLLPVEVVDDISFELDTGYRRSVARSSRWVMTGRITQGVVYRPLRDVFTVQGVHQHEAYLVVNHGQLMGFYVPFDQSFVPQSAKVTIKFTN